MTRVSSFGNSQTMVQGLLNNQSRLFETQEQVNTGKKSTTFGGLGPQVSTLLDARALKSRNATYTETIKQVQGKLDLNENQLKGMLEQAEDLKDIILNAIGGQQAVLFHEQAESAFSFIVTALNSQVAGVHTFAGSKTDIPPVNAKTLADLQALPTVADAFDNDNIQPEAIVSEGVKLPYGLLASDIAEPLFQVFRDIADFDIGPDGPLDGKLTDNQMAFLQTTLTQVTDAIDTMRQSQVENGQRQNRVETLRSQQEEQDGFLASFVSEIEDVNMAEAITNLQQRQTVLQASYQVVAQIGRLNLTGYI